MISIMLGVIIDEIVLDLILFVLIMFLCIVVILFEILFEFFVILIIKIFLFGISLVKVFVSDELFFILFLINLMDLIKFLL